MYCWVDRSVTAGCSIVIAGAALSRERFVAGTVVQSSQHAGAWAHRTSAAFIHAYFKAPIFPNKD